ncbi:MAG: zf-TFIIB domain-containing protein [Gemmatimonadota bacterium]
MNCPNCTTEMETVAFDGTYGNPIDVDICWACHVLWLDKRESLHLSPRGTLDLFHKVHEHRDDPRHTLTAPSQCPRCPSRLKLTHDRGKGGRFSYHSCDGCRGRLTPFSEFLKEKEFVRELTPAEKSQVAAELKSVQCSSCGAPVDVTGGFSCDHCGSPIAVLDAEAVERTLSKLHTENAERSGDPVEKEMRARVLASMETMRSHPDDHLRGNAFRRAPGGLGVDLLSASLSMLFSRF